MAGTRSTGYPRATAMVLVAMAGMYLVGITLVAPLIEFMAEGWIFNPEAYPWWRLTSLYAVVDVFWMRAGVFLTLGCALALARRRRWAPSLAVSIAVVGLASRSLASGGHLLVWLLWDRSNMSRHMRIELVLTGAIVLACASVIYLLRGRHSIREEVVLQGGSVQGEAG